MKKSSVLELKRILVSLRKEIGQFAHSKLCAEILLCWLNWSIDDVCDNEDFADVMIECFQSCKYPFN